MSIEVRAGWPCPHLLIEEPVLLGEDRRSLVTRAPIGGSASVRILANDSVYIPQTGLLSQARLSSFSAAPYRIQRCSGTIGPDGNKFRVTTASGTAEVSLPTGDRVTLAQVQRVLRLSDIGGLVEVTDKDGTLLLIDTNNAGKESYIRVAGQGADQLGFSQKGARGKVVYPGWRLVARQDMYPTPQNANSGLNLVPARYPEFVSSLKGNPNLKVTYSSTPERCPRCGGTWVENDYRFDQTGSVITIQNEDLLYQACLKAVLTVQGSNPYHSNYGSKITTRVGGKIVGASAALIREDVVTALNRVQALQKAQRKYQQVTSRELLYQISSVEVRPAEEDPTVFFLDVVVRNGSNQPVSLSTVFSVPGTFALGGTNATSLGQQRSGITQQIIR